MQSFYNHEKNKIHSLVEALKLVKSNSLKSNNDSYTLTIKLNLDQKKAAHKLNGQIKMPNYIGDITNLLVIDDESNKKDFSTFEIVEVINKDAIPSLVDDQMIFDFIIANSKLSKEIEKVANHLSRKGKLPNTKNGSLTTNVKKAVEEKLTSIVNYKNDKYGNVQLLVGRKNMDDDKIIKNIQYVMDFIKSIKPSGVSGDYIQSITLSSIMGPSVKLVFDNNINGSFKKQEPIAKPKPQPQPKPQPKPIERKVDEESLRREKEQLKVVEAKPVVEKDTKGEKKKGIDAPPIIEKTSIIMISVDAKEAESFLNDDEKNVLFYKVTPVNKVKRVLIYATAPIKGVIGEFDLEKIEICALSTAWKKYSHNSVLDKKTFDEYYEGKEKAHILVSHKSFWYSKPKTLKDFNMNKGPSGFQYLK